MHIASWAPQLPPSFEFTFTLPPKNKNRLPPKKYRRIALPPNNYRRIASPPKKYRHILVYRFRQSRYHRKMKNITAEKIPPYFGLPLPPKSLPPKTRKPPIA